MSVGRNLQEMENVVTKGAAPAEPMNKTGSWEDLGGPTPENYRPDDNSAQLKMPGATLKSVKNVVNQSAVAAEPMSVAKEESEYDEEDELLEASHSEEDDKDKKKEDDDMHPSSKKKSKKEEKVEEEFDIEEDMDALLAGEELSEEFQEKARTIFEAAIKSKIAEIKEDLEVAYQEQLIEEIQSIKSELVERVDAYLEYASDEWMQENEIAIEHGLKNEMTESFLAGMRGLFEDHYVTVPEDRYDVIENMVDKLDEMETKLNEQIEKNIALNKRLAESVITAVFAEVSEGLALSQKDKLASLAENVEFDCEANYREKLVTLRNSYFSTNTGTQRNISENLSEEVEYDIKNSVLAEGVMGTYLQTLQRVSKK
jgi:hypothetical protein